MFFFKFSIIFIVLLFLFQTYFICGDWIYEEPKDTDGQL